MRQLTKEEIIAKLREIRNQGWLVNNRAHNDGGAGNTLEDLLGIEENNLPLPNSGEWELKCQIQTSSLVTLFHCEPSPRAYKFVPKILLPIYGWAHQEAGTKYPETEKSFRQTINAAGYSNRGFKVAYDAKNKKVEIDFSYDAIDESEHAQWKKHIAAQKAQHLSPTPYWGATDLFCKLGGKLQNCFYALAKKKKENGVNYVRYDSFLMMSDISMSSFINAIKSGHVYVDFDSRTGHNHGTKFRIKQTHFPLLYENSREI